MKNKTKQKLINNGQLICHNMKYWYQTGIKNCIGMVNKYPCKPVKTLYKNTKKHI